MGFVIIQITSNSRLCIFLFVRAFTDSIIFHKHFSLLVIARLQSQAKSGLLHGVASVSHDYPGRIHMTLICYARVTKQAVMGRDESGWSHAPSFLEKPARFINAAQICRTCWSIEWQNGFFRVFSRLPRCFHERRFYWTHT